MLSQIFGVNDKKKKEFFITNGKQTVETLVPDCSLKNIQESEKVKIPKQIQFVHLTLS